jgi:hypothetical protein
MADTIFRQIDEKVADTLQGNDAVTREMKESMKNSVSILQNEIQAALSGKNPIRDLQELYVRYNDDFFKNVKSPTAQARQVLRSELKSVQRELAAQIDPSVAEPFKQLDRDYTNLLDLEGITLSSAAGAPLKEVGLGDIVKGATAKFLNIPVLGEATVAASVGAKKFLGKDISDIAAGASAIQKQKLAERAGKLADSKLAGVMDKVAEDPVEGAVKAVATGTQVVDDVQPAKPQIRDKQVMDMAENASPEEINMKAQEVRSQYGRDGEKLANTLEKISNRDKNGRRALIFSILQDPMNRKMLGVGVDNVQSGTK